MDTPSYIFICIHIIICFCLCFSRLLLTLPRLVCPRPYASSCWSTNGRGSEIERKTGRKLTERSGAGSLIPPSWSNRSWMWIEKCWTSSLPPTTKQVRVCLTVVQSSFYSSGSVQRRAADAPMTLSDPGSPNRHIRWSLRTREMVGCPPSAPGSADSWCRNCRKYNGRSQVSPTSVPHGEVHVRSAPALFIFLFYSVTPICFCLHCFPRVLWNRGRQQPRGRAYSAVWIQAHLHKTTCNYLLREEGREVGGWHHRERDGWVDVGEGSEARMCTAKQEGEPGKAAQKRGLQWPEGWREHGDIWKEKREILYSEIHLWARSCST